MKIPTISTRGVRTSEAAMCVADCRKALRDVAREFAEAGPNAPDSHLIARALVLAAWCQTLERCRKRDAKRGRP